MFNGNGVELNWLTFVLAALTVYRVSVMVATEEGPFRIFALLRLKTAQRNIPDEKNWIARGVRCPLCVSFWAGWVGALPFAFAQGMSVWLYGLLALSLSGATTIIHKLTS